MTVIVCDFEDGEKDYLLIGWDDGRIKRVSGYSRFTDAWEAMLDDARERALKIDAEVLEEKIIEYANLMPGGNSVVIGLKKNDENENEIYFTYKDRNGMISGNWVPSHDQFKSRSQRNSCRSVANCAISSSRLDFFVGQRRLGRVQDRQNEGVVEFDKAALTVDALDFGHPLGLSEQPCILLASHVDFTSG